MPGQTYPFIIQAGEQKTIGPIGFVPRSIGVDTLTAGFFVHFPDGGFGAWVNPYVTGAIVPAPGANQNIRVSAVDTPSGAAAAATATGAAYGLVFEDFQAPDPGISSGAAASGTAFPLADRQLAGSPYNFDVPTLAGFAGIVCFLKITGGTGTMTLTIADRDPVTGIANAELVSASLSTSNTRLALYPGVSPVANLTGSMVITPNVRLTATLSGGDVIFQATYNLIP